MTDPEFKRALASVQDHVFLATRRPKAHWGFNDHPNFISDNGEFISIAGATIENGNSPATLMNGVRIVKEKFPDTPWVLCGGGTAKAEVSAGLGPIYWFIKADPHDSATFAGVDAVTKREEVIELLKWRGEGLATPKND